MSTNLVNFLQKFPGLLQATGMTAEAIAQHVLFTKKKPWKILPHWSPFSRQNTIQAQMLLTGANLIIAAQRNNTHIHNQPDYIDNLYAQGYLTMQQACKLLDCSAQTFTQLLGSNTPFRGFDANANFVQLWQPLHIEKLREKLTTKSYVTTEQAAKLLGITIEKFKLRLSVKPIQTKQMHNSRHDYIVHLYDTKALDQVRASLRRCPLGGKRRTAAHMALDTHWPLHYDRFQEGVLAWCPWCGPQLNWPTLLVHFDQHLEQGDTIRDFYLRVANQRVKLDQQ